MSDSDNSNSETTFRYKTQSVRKKEDKKDYYNTVKKNVNAVDRINSDGNSKGTSNLKTKNVILNNETDSQIINTPLIYVSQNRKSYIKDESKENTKNNKPLENNLYNKFINTKENNSEAEKTNSLSSDNADEMIDTYGPILPPNWKKNNLESKVIGPNLPPDFNQYQSQSELSVNLISKAHSSKHAGNLENNESDDEVIGPFPVDNKNLSKVETELEERALEIKLKSFTPASKNTVREEWMLELPDVKGINTLGPRQFRSKDGPDMTNRSVWTNTPHSSKNDSSKSNQNDQNIKEVQKRNLEQDKIINDFKKHKKDQKSLLQIHQEKLSKKKKVNEDKCDRRPFNRDIDLKINTFSEEQKKSIFNKAEFLDNRFSSGASKYL